MWKWRSVQAAIADERDDGLSDIHGNATPGEHDLAQISVDGGQGPRIV
jgi:hypothetical protein